MLKAKKIKNLDMPIVYGSDEEMRNWAITILANDIKDSPCPPEAYLVFERLLNAKFLETPVQAIHEDMKTLQSRISHLESNVEARQIYGTQKALSSRAV